MSSGDSGPLSSLGRDARDILDIGVEWVELASKLDVGRYERDDKYHGTERGKPFTPMFLAYLYALVEDESLSGMHDHLESNPELAAAMGFDPNDLPSQSTFLPTRMKDRFSELEPELKTASREITQLARETGSPIGNPVTNIETDDDDDISQRTVDRLLRSGCKSVFENLYESGFFSFELPRPEEPIYDEEDLLSLETIAALDVISANDAGKEMGDMKNEDPNASEDPFYFDGPSGETLLESIKEMSVDEIGDMINDSLQKTYQRAKPKLQELNQATNVKLAIDVTYVAYHGEEGLDWVVGTPKHKDYQLCHKFATAVIVGENTHYVVAVEPLGSVEYMDNDAYPGNEKKNYRPGDITRRLLDRAVKYVDIRVVYADRAFLAADVLAALENSNLYYVIPAPVRDRLKRKVANYDTLKNGFEDDERDVQIYVEQEYPVRGVVRDQPGDTTIYTNLVILPPDEESDLDGPQPFVTNLSVDDELRLDRIQTVQKIERYDYRGGIESSYRSIKQCAANTTSKAIEVRWFHFAFGCVIYNMWLLVDFLTQARTGKIETRTKPRISLQRFLNRLSDQLKKRIRIE